MKRTIVMLGLLAATGMALGSASVVAQSAGSQTAASLVKPKTFVSLDVVPQGKAFEAAVVVDIQQGYHMNSHTPSEAYLIPTSVTATPPAGFKVVDTIYPPGKQIKFQFSDKPLDVYSGSVTVKLKLAADAGAPVGAARIPVVLRYQACSETTCLPPVKVPVDVKVNVAASGTAAHATHPEIFSLKGSK
ncbi:MAG: protein-disulfide reductase DsbD domain-containing protein [Candidatus Acidiferrales bacterium]